jgi:hypothetical protein
VFQTETDPICAAKHEVDDFSCRLIIFSALSPAVLSIPPLWLAGLLPITGIVVVAALKDARLLFSKVAFFRYWFIGSYGLLLLAQINYLNQLWVPRLFTPGFLVVVVAVISLVSYFIWLTFTKEVYVRTIYEADA